ncbi:hypothetical protein [Rariglobus hedericola]|uniref:DUF3108 domain-containing protein n=1 Tax=Rariglobus hedericola TaxID=2597822 RepID=A0A556QND8_9BACT|nr:hypothetical protein [Rariglobus hedericola]TSJ78168.1 hypothetical protein FPL22_02345 [Rariglobus hedericola]
MRLFACLFLLALGCPLIAAPTPPELAEALKGFHAEGTKGWAFTQTTIAGDRGRVERYDPLGKNFRLWTLVQQDGRAPTTEETQKYLELKSRRSSNETAPNVKDQIAPGTCEVLSETAERGEYRFQLKPGDDDDHSAVFMRATFTLHRPTGTIEKVELASTGPFSPVFMVKVQEARTVMTYSLPDGDTPTFLKLVTVRIRGRAMWFRSLDQEMTVTYSDHVYAGKK